MFGLRNKMTNEERAFIAKNQLKKLKSEERTAKLEYDVYKKKRNIKETKAKPRKEAFKRLGKALKPALKQMRENIEKNEKKGSIFEQNTSNKRGNKKKKGGYSSGPFSGGPF